MLVELNEYYRNKKEALKKLSTRPTGRPRAYWNLVLRQSPNNATLTLLDQNGKILNWSSYSRFLLQGQRKRKLNHDILMQLIRPAVLLMLANNAAIQTCVLKGRFKPFRRIFDFFVLNKLKIRKIVIGAQPPHNGCKLPKRRRVRRRY